MQAGGHEFESHHLHVSNEIAWIFDFCDDENAVLTRSKESKRHASTAVNEKPKVSSATQAAGELLKVTTTVNENHESDSSATSNE